MDLADIFRPPARVNVFTQRRIWGPCCNALVEEGCNPDGLTLRLDADDLAAIALAAGDVVQLGFGIADLGMYYTSETTIRSIEGTRVRVRCPDSPQKQPRRAHCRAPIEWAASLGGALAGTTVNLAASGALIAIDGCAPELAVGATVPLVLAPPDRPPFRCTAGFVRQHRDARGRTCIAVRFLDLAEADEMRLQLLVLRATARRYLRCRVDVAAVLAIGDHAVPGQSENLSGNGVLLHVQAPPPLRIGERGSLTLRLGKAEVAIAVVEVIRLEPRGEAGLALALSYVEIEPAQRRAVVDFVLERVRDV